MTRKNIIARMVSSNNKIVSSRFFEQSQFEQMIMSGKDNSKRFCFELLNKINKNYPALFCPLWRYIFANESLLYFLMKANKSKFNLIQKFIEKKLRRKSFDYNLFWTTLKNLLSFFIFSEPKKILFQPFKLFQNKAQIYLWFLSN